MKQKFFGAILVSDKGVEKLGLINTDRIIVAFEKEDQSGYLTVVMIDDCELTIKATLEELTNILTI